MEGYPVVAKTKERFPATRRQVGKRAFRVALLTAFVGLWNFGAVEAAFQFEDVSANTGPFPTTTESMGAAAADINSDGWTDLFIGGHIMRPYIYRNEGDGQFTDITLRIDRSSTWVTFSGDQHSGTFGDFDNDGDQDLMLATGANADGQLFVNYGGYFWDESGAWGVANDDGGWGHFWVDFSGDGLLDIINSEFALSRAWQQTPTSSFVDRRKAAGYDCNRMLYHVNLADFSNDGALDLLCVREAPLEKLYDITPYAANKQNFIDITHLIPRVGPVAESVAGDFDDNLLPDLLVLRGRHRINGAVAGDSSRIEARLQRGKIHSTPVGFTFQGGERVKFDIWSEAITEPDIYIGASGFHPGGMPFELANTDPNVFGTPADAPIGELMHIGYDTAAGQWFVDMHNTGADKRTIRAYVTLTRLSGSSLQNVVNTGLTHVDQPIVPKLLMNHGAPLVDEAQARGLNKKVSCAGAGVGDFDNDGDLDLYLVCRGGAVNLANRAFENTGGGNFVEIPGAAGAVGPVGLSVGDGAGAGDNVVVADFDADGFLDLFVVNGINFVPKEKGGPLKLFRNLGNQNHWLELDLVGVISNRDGLGARVLVTEGGTTRLREQGGGYHRYTQNDRRLHFGLGAGLGSNNAVDLVRVEWPSGKVNEFTDISADAIYRVTEGTGEVDSGIISPVVLGAATGDVPPRPGDECGEPAYKKEYGPAFLLWRECPSQNWQVRAKGGRSRSLIAYRGSVESAQPFNSVTPFNLQGNDTVDTSNPNKALYTLKVSYDADNGFSFNAPAGAKTCFRLDAPADQPVLVGSGRWAAYGAFDLAIFGTCSPGGAMPSISISDTNVGEAAGNANVQVRLSTGSAQVVRADFATADVTAVTPGDYTAKSGTLNFQAGQTVKTISVPIIDDAVEEGTESFGVTLSQLVGATLGNTGAIVTIVDNDGTSPGPSCGQPDYDGATDLGLFVWQDCSYAGPGQRWQVRATAGGSPTPLKYLGTVTSAGNVDATPVSLEGQDVLDSGTGGTVQYTFYLWKKGQDGFTFHVSDAETTCFGVDQQPADAAVRLGSGRRVVTPPFNFATLDPC